MARLSDRLLATGIVGPDLVQAAVARQAVYGGALDTALLELAALDEATLWAALVEATGLGMPDRRLCEAPEKITWPTEDGAATLNVGWSARSRAVPVGLRGGALQILCGEPVAHTEITGALAALRMPAALYVAPEIWIAAVQQAIYGRAMEPRLVRVFAQVVGTHPVRLWQAAHAPPPVAEAPVEIPPPRLPPVVAVQKQPPARAPAPVAPPEPPAALVPPAPVPPTPSAAVSPSPPLPPSPASRPSAPAPAPAPARLGKAAVPKLIERLEDRDDVEDAREKLVEITKQDLGTKAKRWAAWWEAHQDDDRADWLFEGLGHKTDEIRAAAEQELRALTGQYFGYAFDLPRREREAARARWQAWWDQNRPKSRR